LGCKKAEYGNDREREAQAESDAAGPGANILNVLPGLYLRHPLSFEHDTGQHPENAGRIRAIEERLDSEGWQGLEVVEAPPATVAQIERVHRRSHIESIESSSAEGGGMIDADTVVSERSYEAALRSAGGAVHAVDRLLGGGAGFAFCGLRPPGHHAEPSRAMGFCLFNNVAIGIAHALAEHGLERAMVVDWDVHHGNGTQEVFYESGRVLFASIHQSPLYPGTGAPGDTGSGEGEGFTVNLPVAPGAGPDEFLSIVQNVVVPLARDFEPELLAISAGYDAHRADPLADCMLDEGAYADMSASLRDLASELEIPVLICLEGGYALGALATSVSATIGAFRGTTPPRQAPPDPASPYRSRLASRWQLA
jgi:acetoin utilization deacetylase AcuC-like enzyme